MTDWTETHRGAVPPWQCDVTEHFTIAYYFDRLEEADGNLAERIGLHDVARQGGFTRRLTLRFVSELRAGAGFHIESAVLATDTPALRLGHRFVDSASGEVVTWIDAHWDLPEGAVSSDARAAIAARQQPWTGPAAEPRGEPTTTDGFIPTARGRTKPSDLDAAGQFSLSAMVHRFSAASAQSAAALGMDARFMQENRRGFSTFELTMQVSGALQVDEPYLVRTGIGHLGGSSMRMLHHLTSARTGLEVARLGQYGVNLDLDARRPARWPDAVRAKSAALVVPVG